MKKLDYNGWTNYETWNCNLWLSNDESLHNEILSMAHDALNDGLDGDLCTDIDSLRDAATLELREQLTQMVDQLAEQWMPDQSSLFADMINQSINEIDFEAIARHYINGINLYSAGWNMPGYMPDNAPAIFLDASDALDHVRDEADRWIDEENDPEFAGIPSTWKADKSGEFGCTLGAYHYFVARV